MKFKLVTVILTTLMLLILISSTSASVVAADVGVKDAALGEHGVLIIKNDGSVWGWGSNSGYPKDFHAAGIIDPNPSPREVMEDAISVAAGSEEYYAVKSDNSLWAWGLGSLGNGDFIAFNPVKPFKVMDGVKAVYVGSFGSGSDDTFVIKTDNSLWGWGNNGSGSLGPAAAGMMSSDKPVKIMDNVRYVAAGGFGHVLAIKTDNTLWTWGANSYGQLGQGTDKSYCDTPEKIADNVATCAAGVDTSLFITEDHKLYGCGDASYHLLNAEVGTAPGGEIAGSWNTPQLLLDNIISAGIGYMHGAAVDTQGQLYVWGSSGSLGLPNLEVGAYKVMKGALTGVKKVFVHGSYTLAIMNDNSVYAWGDNGDGQVGTGTRSENVGSPVKVMEGGEYQPPAVTLKFTIGQSSYSMGGKSFTMDAAPFISNGRTLVPVRYLADALGAQTSWDATARRVTITDNGTTIELIIGSTAITTNGATSQMDTTPVIVNGRTYLPARYIVEALGYTVSWDANTQTVNIVGK